MARTSKRRSGKLSKRQQQRVRVLAEWYGGVNPPDPKRNVHSASGFVSELLSGIGLSDGLEEERVREVWGKVAGEFVARHTKPESLRSGVLVLRVLQPTMKFHLEQMSSKILANLKRELGNQVVKQVHFKIG